MGKKVGDQQCSSALLENLYLSSFETPLENRQTEEGYTTPEPERIPLNMEPPRVLNSPRKKRNSTSARELITKIKIYKGI